MGSGGIPRETAKVGSAIICETDECDIYNMIVRLYILVCVQYIKVRNLISTMCCKLLCAVCYHKVHSLTYKVIVILLILLC